MRLIPNLTDVRIAQRKRNVVRIAEINNVSCHLLKNQGWQLSKQIEKMADGDITIQTSKHNMRLTLSPKEEIEQKKKKQII